MRLAILGATGQIGSRMVQAAVAAGHDVRALARKLPADKEPGADWRAVDAYDPGALANVVVGCEAMVSVLGLPYDIAAWQGWPSLTRSVAGAAQAAGSRLIWLENAYSYGHTVGPVTEQTPLAPASRMGKARAESFQVLLGAGAAGLEVTVARAADFLGPGIETSVVGWTPIARAAAGHGGVRWLPWIGNPNTSHSYALVSEVVAGLLQLAEAPTAAGVWHLPATTPVTGRELCAALGRIAGRRVLPLRTPTILLKVAGVVIAPAAAAADNAYLTLEDFVLDDSRFRESFHWGPATTVESALTDLLRPAATPEQAKFGAHSS